ncbi:MAG: methionine adenosyltransferase [Cellulomonadaceae bacterium]|jgi:S-adenosylmethionine synthetase|nr:methionine adenosyltransferase [Cellulomonadaceae bacterium]
MIEQNHLFTSESVTEGHPDKVCDQISDAILDELLAQDKKARVAVETLAATGFVLVAGEVTTDSYVEIPHIVREVVSDIGYNSSEIGFDASSCGVTVAIGSQSPDIAMGVGRSTEVRSDVTDSDPYDGQGAGDQGLIFGYACDDTPELMPLPIHLAHRLSERLTYARKELLIPGLRPDGKTQVTVAYEGGKPVAVETIVVSAQHDPDKEQDWLHNQIAQHVVAPVLAENNIETTAAYSLLVNPTGRFVVGGPKGDTGLTGRKIIVDSYGGMARHGGGAYSGKDPSKVDRSAAYALRWVAKNVVAAGLAQKCEIQISYAIGRAHPISLSVECFGTENVPVATIQAAINSVFDLRPAAIIDALDLLKPIYRSTSNYGHFGRELPQFTWEQTNRTQELQNAV